MTGKCEIYIDKDGLEYVDANLRFTEFSRMLYTESYILKILNDTIDILKEDKQYNFNDNKGLLLLEFKRQLLL